MEPLQKPNPPGRAVCMDGSKAGRADTPKGLCAVLQQMRVGVGGLFCATHSSHAHLGAPTRVSGCRRAVCLPMAVLSGLLPEGPTEEACRAAASPTVGGRNAVGRFKRTRALFPGLMQARPSPGRHSDRRLLPRALLLSLASNHNLKAVSLDLSGCEVRTVGASQVCLFSRNSCDSRGHP